MRILVANDDGIDAPGLDRLARAARCLSDDVWVVAPDGKRTAAGASITIGRPLTMVEHTERRYACSGTPADCVVAAMAWLLTDRRSRIWCCPGSMTVAMSLRILLIPARWGSRVRRHSGVFRPSGFARQTGGRSRKRY
ncbi:hypothetical protein DEA98_25900 [Brucella pseudogrignonensis]|nr:hypothetical protein [Brucella pseudogrignonensis]